MKWYHRFGIFSTEDYYMFLGVAELNELTKDSILESGYQQFAGALPKWTIFLMFKLALFTGELIDLKEPNEDGETYRLGIPSQIQAMKIK